jgi:hypothetical protein
MAGTRDDPRPAARIAAMLKRYSVPRMGYAGDYDKDFAERILDDLAKGGYRVQANGPGRFPEPDDPPVERRDWDADDHV